MTRVFTAIAATTILATGGLGGTIQQSQPQTGGTITLPRCQPTIADFSKLLESCCGEHLIGVTAEATNPQLSSFFTLAFYLNPSTRTVTLVIQEAKPGSPACLFLTATDFRHDGEPGSPA